MNGERKRSVKLDSKYAFSAAPMVSRMAAGDVSDGDALQRHLGGTNPVAIGVGLL